MIRAVTKTNRCPICGKGDWCGIMSSTDGGYLHVCQRNVDTLKPFKDGVIGTDGRYYVCVGISKEGENNIFEEADQLKEKESAKKEQYKSEYKKKAATRKVEHILTQVDPVYPLDNVKLDAVYRKMLSYLILEPEHRAMLIKDGWTEDLMEQNLIRSFPVDDFTRFKDRTVKSRNVWRKELGEKLAHEFGDLKGVPGAYLNKKGKWTFAGQGGMLFPLYDECHRIYRLRVRLDHVESGGKYRNFASWKMDEEAEKQGFLLNTYKWGCQADNHLGFYFNAQRDDMYIAYITEGEKKGIIGEHILKAPFVSVPGVSSYGKLVEGAEGCRPIDHLRYRGVKILIIAFDADKSVNEKVLASQNRTIAILKKHGFQIGLAEWDMQIAKGIDDLLIRGYKPRYTLA